MKGPVQQAERQTPQADVMTPPGGRSLWRDAWRRLRHQRVAMICLAVIAAYALIALGAGVYEGIAAHSEELPSFEESADYQRTNLPPFESWKYPLGTDWSGRSILWKVLLGAKVSMSVALVANIIAVPLGMLLGAVAGYYGGKSDALVVWLFSTLASIPGIVLLLALKFAFTGKTLFEETWAEIDLSGTAGLYLALAMVSWIGTCRLVRAEVLKVRELDYIMAARATGTNGFIILLRHVLPNVAHLGIINFSLGFIGAIKAEVILTYLGLGVDVGTPSWGAMISAAQLDLKIGRWWELTAAVAAMFFLVLALNLFGDRLRDALDPRLRGV